VTLRGGTEPSEEDTVNKSKSFCSPSADLMTTAERELGAFIGAVTELYGSEQARLSAEDWLNELALMDDLPGSANQN